MYAQIGVIEKVQPVYYCILNTRNINMYITAVGNIVIKIVIQFEHT